MHLWKELIRRDYFSEDNNFFNFWNLNCSMLDYILLKEVQKEQFSFLVVPVATKNSNIHRYREGASFSYNSFPNINSGKQQKVTIELKFSKN